MSYVLYLIHLMYFSLMLGRVMLACDSFALVGWTSTPKGGLMVWVNCHLFALNTCATTPERGVYKDSSVLNGFLSS